MRPNAFESRLILATLAVVAALGLPALLPAQDWSSAAEEIRVLEVVDSWSGRTERAVVEDLSPAEIRRVQLELADAGYDPRSRSGVVDERTRRALARFQSGRGLEVCGCVSYETVVALGIVPVVVARLDDDRRAGSTVIYERYDPVVVFVPVPSHHRRHDVFRGPGVFVGHQPAVGSGGFHRRFPSRPELERDRRPVPRPVNTFPGSRIRPGDGQRSAPRVTPPPSSGTARGPRPRPN